MTRLQARMAAVAMLGASAALAQAPIEAQVLSQLAGQPAGAAVAAPSPAAPLADAPPVEAPAGAHPALLTTEGLRAARILDAEGVELGSIVDFVLQPAPVEGNTAADRIADPGLISHVVVELAGLLGMGRHPVAVPFSELRISPADDGHLRISLPWTEMQLRSVPAWNPDNPATLGLSGPDDTMALEPVAGGGAR